MHNVALEREDRVAKFRFKYLGIVEVRSYHLIIFIVHNTIQHVELAPLHVLQCHYCKGLLYYVGIITWTIFLFLNALLVCMYHISCCPLQLKPDISLDDSQPKHVPVKV